MPLSVTMVLVAVAVSTSCGVIFGFWPAWQASKLSPIEALRFE
jgi:ABC-type antimicrobial peptide transport system permease subunit